MYSNSPIRLSSSSFNRIVIVYNTLIMFRYHTHTTARRRYSDIHVFVYTCSWIRLVTFEYEKNEVTATEFGVCQRVYCTVTVNRPYSSIFYGSQVAMKGIQELIGSSPL